MSRTGIGRVRATVVAVAVVASVMLTVGGASAAAASNKPVKGGSFTYITAFSPRTFDPAKAVPENPDADTPYSYALYDVLVRLDPSTGKVLPHLAKSLTSKDATSWTLVLRPGIKFSDGTPFDAAAVKFNWERLALPATASSSLSTAQLITAMDASDPTTLKITLNGPNAIFDSLVAGTMSYIASPAALQKFGANYGTSPETTVGAGPFVLKQWTRDAQVSMDRNPNYWNSPRPYVDSLVIKFFSDPTAGWNTFQTGGGDGFVNSLLGTNALSRPCDAGFPTLDLKEPSPGLVFQAFNTKRYPFNDARARRAFLMAVDPKKFVSTVLQGNGRVRLTFFDKGSPWYDPDHTLPKYDPKEAQRLFSEVAAASGKPVEFSLLTLPTSTTFGEFMQAQLNQYQNVKLNLDITQPSDILAKVTRGDYDISPITTGAPYDPSPVLTRFFIPGGGLFLGYDNPQLQTLIKQGYSTTELAERQKIYRQVFEIMSTDLPMSFSNYASVRPCGLYSFQKTVQHATAYHGSVFFEDLWIGKSK